MKKARIVKTKVGIKTFYYAQVETRFMFFFKTWDDLAGVFLRSGHVSWYRSLGTKDDAMRHIKELEELYGIEFEISEVER